MSPTGTPSWKTITGARASEGGLAPSVEGGRPREPGEYNPRSPWPPTRSLCLASLDKLSGPSGKVVSLVRDPISVRQLRYISRVVEMSDLRGTVWRVYEVNVRELLRLAKFHTLRALSTETILIEAGELFPVGRLAKFSHADGTAAIIVPRIRRIELLDTNLESTYASHPSLARR